jgi:gamma-glutamyl:cysteine ligase YbdK (ATP-grasp superfamily)
LDKATKKLIDEGDKLAKKDVNSAYNAYKQAYEKLQAAGDNASLQDLYNKMVALSQATPAQPAAAKPAASKPKRGSAPAQSMDDESGHGEDYSKKAQEALAAQQAYYASLGHTGGMYYPPWATAVPKDWTGNTGWHYLPFTNGVEMELQMIRKDGTFMSGDQMVNFMGDIVKGAHEKLKSWMDERLMPDYIAQKMGGYPELYNDHEKGLIMRVPSPLPDGSRIMIDSFGRDGNVAAITYILELVTPVCSFVEELAWWESTLISLAQQCIPASTELNIVSTGLNPMQEYMRGLSFSDHNHLGSFSSSLEKMQYYDMIRNFIPAIISLSANSPIVLGKPTDEIKVVKGRYAAPGCVRSVRLLNNTTMLSGTNNPNKYPPYILDDNEETRQNFLRTVGKADFYDARFQDLYPYTDFGTIEVRVQDAQMSVCRRVGMSMLLQTLGYKTRKILAAGRYVPCVSSETIVKNRERAVKQGLFGTFTTEGINEQEFRDYDPEFSDMYLGPAGGEGKPRYLFEHVQRLLQWLAPEFKELGYNRSPYLQPLLVSVYGDIPNGILPPFNEADYQLSLYYYKMSNRQDTNIIPELANLTKQYSLNITSHPLGGGKVNYPKGFL